MKSIEDRIVGLNKVGLFLKDFISNKNNDKLQETIQKTQIENPWFTEKNILYSINHWGEILSIENIKNWLSKYNLKKLKPTKVGLVLAGNIPMVGLHDCICCLLTGANLKIKLSSKDSKLIPFILNMWREFSTDLEFSFVDKLTDFEAVIATGSDNTSRYFEYYFRNIPHIIRKNRTSIAIIKGNESEEEMKNLGKDIFTYFGLGCRNISYLLIPQEYNLDNLYSSFKEYEGILNHNKYANNYEYNRAIYILNKDSFWDNNYILMKDSPQIFSPIASLNYSKYKSEEEILNFISLNKDKIQIIISSDKDIQDSINFGNAQNPTLSEYEDRIDVMDFLISI